MDDLQLHMMTAQLVHDEGVRLHEEFMQQSAQAIRQHQHAQNNEYHHYQRQS